MTDKLKQQLQMVAEYLILTEGKVSCSDKGEFITFVLNGGSLETTFYKWKELHYHDRIEWLWPVAGKVVDELKLIGTVQSSDALHNITVANNTYNTPTLFTAVCAGIEALNEKK